MMLLRTLVLEPTGENAPLNGALLCGFAVPQITSNFLVYSLDEETGPGNARVYIAALSKKLDRYFLSGVGAQEELQIATQVFKQILTLAASGAKPASATDTQIPYHFVDLKGCKLPPARPNDHHSVIIKKALVMKVITLSATAPASVAIESTSLIVPSIRFSSQTVSSPKLAAPVDEARPRLLEPPVESQRQSLVASAPAEPAFVDIPKSEPPALAAPAEPSSLVEVDSTLTSLARVAQELTAQKTAVLKQEEALEQWKSRLQQGQAELDQGHQELVNRTLEKEASLQLRTQALESREAQLASALVAQQNERERIEGLAATLEKRVAQASVQELEVSQNTAKLAAMLTQLQGGRQNLQAMLFELDQGLGGLVKRDESAQMGSAFSGVTM